MLEINGDYSWEMNMSLKLRDECDPRLLVTVIQRWINHCEGPDSGEAAQTTMSRQAAEGAYFTLSQALFHPSSQLPLFLIVLLPLSFSSQKTVSCVVNWNHYDCFFLPLLQHTHIHTENIWNAVKTEREDDSGCGERERCYWIKTHPSFTYTMLLGFPI